MKIKQFIDNMKTLLKGTERYSLHMLGELDIEPAIAIAKESGITYSRERLAWATSKKRRMVFGAFDAMTLLGWSDWRLGEKAITLDAIVVGEQYRYHGIGRLMIDRMLEIARYQCFERVAAEVDEYDVTAQVFLRQCGFKWQFTFELDGKTFYRMVREVSK